MFTRVSPKKEVINAGEGNIWSIFRWRRGLDAMYIYEKFFIGSLVIQCVFSFQCDTSAIEIKTMVLEVFGSWETLK